MGRTSDAKERLMSATLDLIWSSSYGAVTIDEICVKAGVKKGSFYYFFDSKSELAIAAVDRLWREDWKPRLDSLFSPTVEPLKRLTGYLAHLYQNQVNYKARTGHVLGCPMCSVGSEVGARDDRLGHKVRELMEGKRRYIESAIRDALAEGSIERCDPVQKARSLCALIEGCLGEGRIMNDTEPIRRLPAMAFDLLRVGSGLATLGVGANFQI
ncbi:MAG: TetR/AcrR family transcriptional regulator [Opitutaceae bacterium]